MVDNTHIKEGFDFSTINVDELEFTCVDKRFEDECGHPETGELLKKPFNCSGLRLETQFDDIYVQEFSQGGGYEYVDRKQHVPETAEAYKAYTAFVLFLGGLRIPLSVADSHKFAEDGTTRIWEVKEIGERGVYCISPFGNVEGLKKAQANVVIAKPFKFESQELSKKIANIIVSALSSFNHKKRLSTIRKDGKEATLQEKKELYDLFCSDKNKYNEIYSDIESIEKTGDSKVILSRRAQKLLLSKGELS